MSTRQLPVSCKAIEDVSPEPEVVTGEVLEEPEPLWEEWSDPVKQKNYFNVRVSQQYLANLTQHERCRLRVAVDVIKEILS